MGGALVCFLSVWLSGPLYYPSAFRGNVYMTEGLDFQLKRVLSSSRQVGGADGDGRSICVLEICTGVHTGASLDLKARPYSVGSSPKSDIVLIDDGVSATHLRLYPRGRHIDVEAVGGDVALAGGRMIPMGKGRRCKLPLRVSIGETGMKLTASSKPPLEPFGTTRFLSLLAVAVAGITGVTVAVAGLSMAAPGRIIAQPAAALMDSYGTLDLAQVRFGAPRSLHNPVTPTFRNAADQLRGRLNEAGIGMLRVDELDHRLIVSGSLQKEEQRDAWNRTRSWFDKNYGNTTPIVADISQPKQEEPPYLSLRAIWYGSQPYIIMADGERYHEGAITNGGWSIEQIGERELVLAKGSAKVALKYP